MEPDDLGLIPGLYLLVVLAVDKLVNFLRLSFCIYLMG